LYQLKSYSKQSSKLSFYFTYENTRIENESNKWDVGEKNCPAWEQASYHKSISNYYYSLVLSALLQLFLLHFDDHSVLLAYIVRQNKDSIPTAFLASNFGSE